MHLATYCPETVAELQVEPGGIVADKARACTHTDQKKKVTATLLLIRCKTNGHLADSCKAILHCIICNNSQLSSRCPILCMRRTKNGGEQLFFLACFDLNQLYLLVPVHIKLFFFYEIYKAVQCRVLQKKMQANKHRSLTLCKEKL